MHIIGVDLGQRVDYTAVAVVERVEHRVEGFDYVRWMNVSDTLPDEWVVRRLERAPLGTPYTRVVEWLREITRIPAIRGDCRMVVDATGVGLPVVDMLRAARLECELMPVVLTGGFYDGYDGKVWSAPKLDLLMRLQMLLEQRRLRVAQGVTELGPLQRELLDVRTRQRKQGRLGVGAEGSGEHDDLVMAVALAVWMGRKPKMGMQGRVGWMDRRVV